MAKRRHIKRKKKVRKFHPKTLGIKKRVGIRGPRGRGRSGFEATSSGVTSLDPNVTPLDPRSLGNRPPYPPVLTAPGKVNAHGTEGRYPGKYTTTTTTTTTTSTTTTSTTTTSTTTTSTTTTSTTTTTTVWYDSMDNATYWDTSSAAMPGISNFDNGRWEGLYATGEVEIFSDAVWVARGEFLLEVEFEIDSVEAAGGEFYFYVVEDVSKGANGMVGVTGTGGAMTYVSYLDSLVAWDPGDIPNTGTFKFRIARDSNNNLTAWVFHDGTWQWNGNASGIISTGGYWNEDMYVRLVNWNQGLPDYYYGGVPKVTLHYGTWVDLT